MRLFRGRINNSWIASNFGILNEFVSNSINPARRPNEKFELYSVPSFVSGIPEVVIGSSIGSMKQEVQPGDVLVCKINPRINRVWLVGQKIENEQIASSEWIGFRSGAMIQKFACYYFSSPRFRDLLCSEVAGVGGSLTRAQPKRVVTYPIPLAPLSEQTRIADQLDALLARVQACNDRFDAIPELLKRFRQTVLDAATSGQFDADERHDRGVVPRKTVQLAEVARDFSYGSSAKSAKSGLVPVLRMGNIQSGHLDWSDLVYTSDSKEIEKYNLSKGDVLFNRTNSPELVGKTAVFQGERDAIYAGYLIRVRCLPDLLPEYLNYCLGSTLGRDYCWSVKSDGVSQSNINAKKLAAFEFQLPNIEEQTKIVSRVEALFALADRIETRYTAARAHAQRLTPLLLAKAFRGELVPQDPSDEPASALLQRIVAQHTQAELLQKPRKPRVARAARAPKEPPGMTKSRQDADVKDQPYLADHLRRLGGANTAEALFKVAELPVADFYKQLAWEVAKGHIKDRKTALEAAHAP